jgi:hypothetical protein
MNYFLGIDTARRVLAADFEDMSGGNNHPASARRRSATTSGITPRRPMTAPPGASI